MSKPFFLIPTRAQVQQLKPGDMALNAFGEFRRVTEITAQQDDIHGNAFVCFYTEFGPSSTISQSMKEGEPVHTVPITSEVWRMDSVPLAGLEAGKVYLVSAIEHTPTGKPVAFSFDQMI